MYIYIYICIYTHTYIWHSYLERARAAVLKCLKFNRRVCPLLLDAVEAILELAALCVVPLKRLLVRPEPIAGGVVRLGEGESGVRS